MAVEKIASQKGKKTMEIRNKGVLITGGASGLGAASARLLAENGARVFIADLNSEGGETLASELRASGADAHFVHTNVTSEESVQAAIQAATDGGKSLHILINCAGIGIAEKVMGKGCVHSLESF